jgi:hypothetical protein
MLTVPRRAGTVGPAQMDEKSGCFKVLNDPAAMRPPDSHVALAVADAPGKSAVDFHHAPQMGFASFDFGIGEIRAGFNVLVHRRPHFFVHH